METTLFEVAYKELAHLETFLGGMETDRAPATPHSASRTLETFLGGMETQNSLRPSIPRLALKPSLVEWKLRQTMRLRE